MTESLERREVLWSIVKMLEIQRKHGADGFDGAEGGTLQTRLRCRQLHLFSLGDPNERQTQNQDQPEGAHA